MNQWINESINHRIYALHIVMKGTVNKLFDKIPKNVRKTRGSCLVSKSFVFTNTDTHVDSRCAEVHNNEICSRQHRRPQHSGEVGGRWREFALSRRIYGGSCCKCAYCRCPLSVDCETLTPVEKMMEKKVRSLAPVFRFPGACASS